MRGMPPVICCWPGLPKLWLRGDGASLAMAVAFGAALNGLLVSWLLRPAWLPASISVAAWMVFGGVWLWATLRECRQLPSLLAPVSAADHRGLFLQAQGEYLQGHWFEAESVLSELLRHTPRDVDARLLLATLYRRTKRYAEALTELKRLEQFDQAVKWQAEIVTERRLANERWQTRESNSAPIQAGEPAA